MTHKFAISFGSSTVKFASRVRSVYVAPPFGLRCATFPSRVSVSVYVLCLGEGVSLGFCLRFGFRKYSLGHWFFPNYLFLSLSRWYAPHFANARKLSDANEITISSNKESNTELCCSQSASQQQSNTLSNNNNYFTMAKKGKSPAKPLKEPKHDEEGKIMNWDSSWDDALVLRMYIEKGLVTGLTALKIQEKYPEPFNNYTNKALTGGLKTLRDSVAKEFAAARAGGSNGVFGCADWVHTVNFFGRLLSVPSTFN